jgi:hypothetical protein
MSSMPPDGHRAGWGRARYGQDEHACSLGRASGDVGQAPPGAFVGKRAGLVPTGVHLLHGKGAMPIRGVFHETPIRLEIVTRR